MEKNENHPIPLPRRRLTRRGFIRGMGIAAGVVTLAPVIAACGSSNNTTKTSNANTSNSASTSGTTAPAGSATAASAAPSGAVTPIGGAAGAPSAADLASADKQTLTLVNVEPNFLDPQRASFGSDIAVIKQIYRGLLYIDKNDPNKVIAAAAKDVPSASNGGISSDGKTYTLHLNSGLKWQDGSALTAKDFEYSIKRLFDPNLAGDYSSFYFNIVGSEDYYNALGTKAAPKKPTTDQLTQLQNGVGVQATDDSTLVIKLINPQPSFNTLLTLWPVFPVQKAQIDKYADKAFAEASNIVGNGPFKLSEWVHKDHLTLVPNTNWWGQDKPYLQKLVMKDIEDDTVAFTAYKNGELDMTGVPIADVNVVKSDPTLSKENYRADQQTTYGLEFNVSKAPFDDVNFRHAMSEAIDRTSFINSVQKGVGKPAYSWLPPGVPDYDPELGMDYKFDAAKAKADLAKSKYASSVPAIKFTFVNSASAKIRAAFVQDQLKTNLGVNIDLEALESATYKSRYQQDDFQMVFGGWGSDYADPEDWLPQLFGTGAGNNKYMYSNPQVDALFKQAQTTTDNTQRLNLYKQAQQIIVQDMPVAFIYYAQTNGLKKPYVQGVIPTGLDGLGSFGEAGDWFFTNVYISKSKG